MSAPFFVTVNEMSDFIVVFTIYIFMVGVASFIIMFLALSNKCRLELNKNNLINAQGVKMIHYKKSVILLLFGIGLYLISIVIKDNYLGCMLIGLFGAIIIIFQNVWINMIVTKFNLSKYERLEKFRR